MKRLFILLSIFFFGCAPRTYMAGYDRQKVRTFNNIMIIEPTFSLVEIDEQYRKAIYDYETETKEIFRREFQPYVNATHSMYLSVDSLPIKKDTLLWLLAMGFQNKHVDSVLVNQILPEKKHATKLLISHMSGFYKTPKLVKWENTKTILWAVFTLGMYYPIYFEYVTTYDMVMIDLDSYQVVFKESRRDLEDMRQKETVAAIIQKATRL